MCNALCQTSMKHTIRFFGNTLDGILEVVKLFSGSSRFRYFNIRLLSLKSLYFHTRSLAFVIAKLILNKEYLAFQK